MTPLALSLTRVVYVQWGLAAPHLKEYSYIHESFVFEPLTPRHRIGIGGDKLVSNFIIKMK